MQPNIDKIIENAGGKVKCYFGAGHINRHEEGYLNVDIRTFPHIDYVCDIGQTLPFEDEFADEIYAESLLEHLHMGDYATGVTYSNTIKVLKEWIRVLKHGGELLLKVPNIEGLANEYIKGTIPKFEFFRYLYGGQEYPENTHTAGFDKETMSFCLEQAGFSKYEFIHSHNDKEPLNQKAGWEMRVRAIR